MKLHDFGLKPEQVEYIFHSDHFGKEVSQRRRMLDKFNCSEWHLGEEGLEEEEDIGIELYRWKYREVGGRLTKVTLGHCVP